RPQRAAAFGVFDHRLADAVLHRAGGVEHLQLGEDGGLVLARDPAEADDGRAAHQLRDVVVDPSVHGVSLRGRLPASNITDVYPNQQIIRWWTRGRDGSTRPRSRRGALSGRRGPRGEGIPAPDR